MARTRDRAEHRVACTRSPAYVSACASTVVRHSQVSRCSWWLAQHRPPRRRARLALFVQVRVLFPTKTALVRTFVSSVCLVLSHLLGVVLDSLSTVRQPIVELCHSTRIRQHFEPAAP